MRLVIQESVSDVGAYAADYIRKRINSFQPSANRPFFVLGLPTGSSPIPTYQKLIQYHKDGCLSFKNVVTFNMDEYVGLPRHHAESYWTFMHENLFDHIDIAESNINMLDGNRGDGRLEDLEKECQYLEGRMQKQISPAAGAID